MPHGKQLNHVEVMAEQRGWWEKTRATLHNGDPHSLCSLRRQDILSPEC
jgi:hypothetical protein